MFRYKPTLNSIRHPATCRSAFFLFTVLEFSRYPFFLRSPLTFVRRPHGPDGRRGACPVPTERAAWGPQRCPRCAHHRTHFVHLFLAALCFPGPLKTQFRTHTPPGVMTMCPPPKSSPPDKVRRRATDIGTK